MPTTYTITTNAGEAVNIPVYTPNDISTYASYGQLDSMPKHPSYEDMDTFIDSMYKSYKEIRKASKDVSKYKSTIENFKSILNSKRSVVEKLILCKMAIEGESVYTYIWNSSAKIPEDKFKDYLNSDVKLDAHK